MRRWLVLDESVRRLDGGKVLLGGSPMRLLRLTDAGTRVVDRIEAGEAVAASGLVDRLLAAGAVHPRAIARRIFEDSASYAPAEDQVTVVMPAFGVAADDLARRIARIGEVAAVVVVDDASAEPVCVPSGVRLLRHERNLGPGAARQSGLAVVETPIVAFVDTDVELPDDWLGPLLAHLADPHVVAVAPRIAGRPDPGGRLAAYDAARSPLDLGTRPGPVRARTRISYVPTAVLVARTDAIRACGGFDPALRTGEDVDLVWRLAAASGEQQQPTVRYEPGVVAYHDPRPTLTAWLRQRAGYGRSAAPLARRHPDALAPVAVSAWSALAWTLAAAGAPVAGLAVAAGSAAALPRKLRALEHPVREGLRIAGRGHLFAGRQLAGGITRAWWPLAVAAALVSRRARRTLAAACLIPALVDWRRTRPPELGPVTYVALRALDDAAYGAGLWLGMLAERTIAPIVPDLTSWPGRATPRDAIARRRTPRTPSPG